MAQVSQVFYVLIFIGLLTLLVFPNSELLITKMKDIINEGALTGFEVSAHVEGTVLHASSYDVSYTSKARGCSFLNKYVQD